MTQDAIIRPDPSPNASMPARQVFIGTIGMGIILAAMPTHATDPQGPWECSGYTGEAHTRCLAAFVEAQREQIASLQGKVQAQQETVNQLKAQMEHQASARADLQRRLAPPPTVVPTVPPLYWYPPVGVGLYLGRPWFYGPPYFYRPYFYGPHYFGYGHRGRRW